MSGGCWAKLAATVVVELGTMVFTYTLYTTGLVSGWCQGLFLPPTVIALPPHSLVAAWISLYICMIRRMPPYNFGTMQTFASSSA